MITEYKLAEVVLNSVRPSRLKTFLETAPSNDEEAMMMLTLGGMAKYFTYPVTYIDKSIENVTSKPGAFNPNREGGEDALKYFRRTFCRNNLRRHKEWPPIQIT